MLGTINCTYETPCGWCTKWDKKCDKKIGCDNSKPRRGLRAKTGCLIEDTAGLDFELIRSGILPLIGTGSDRGIREIE